jgi:hypothetical protein
MAEEGKLGRRRGAAVLDFSGVVRPVKRSPRLLTAVVVQQTLPDATIAAQDGTRRLKAAVLGDGCVIAAHSRCGGAGRAGPSANADGGSTIYTARNPDEILRVHDT